MTKNNIRKINIIVLLFWMLAGFTQVFTNSAPQEIVAAPMDSDSAPHEGGEQQEQQEEIVEDEPTVSGPKTKITVTVPKVSVGMTDLKQVTAENIQAAIANEIAANNGSITLGRLLDIWNRASMLINKNAALNVALLNFLPKAFLNNKSLMITNAVVAPGPYEFPHSFVLTGTMNGSIDMSGTVDAMGMPTNKAPKTTGKPLAVSFLYAPVVPSMTYYDPSQSQPPTKGGASLSIGIPAGTALEKIIPGINTKVLGGIPITDMRCVLSDCEYMDPALYCRIAKGLTVVAGIDPTRIGILNSDKVKNVIQYNGGPVYAVGTLEQNPDYVAGATAPASSEAGASPAVKAKPTLTTCRVVVPPSSLSIKQFKLSQLAELLSVPMPQKVKNELSQIVFKSMDISMDLTPGYEQFSLSSPVKCFNMNNVLVSYKVFKAQMTGKDIEKAHEKDPNNFQYSTWVNIVSFQLPNGWNVSKSFPELAFLSSVSIKEPTLTLTSTSYLDPMLFIEMQKGIQLEGIIDIGKMGNNPILKTLSAVIGQRMVLHGLLSDDAATSFFDVTLGKDRPKEIKLSLGDLIPSQYGSVKNELSKGVFSIGEVRMRLGGKDVEQSLKVKGTSSISNIKMPTELQLIYGAAGHPGEWKGNLLISIPQKVKGVSSSLDMLDSLPLSSLRLALIQAPFFDRINYIDYQAGLNIGGFLGFSGPFSFLKKILPAKNLTGLNLNGIIGMKDITSGTRAIRLEASIPDVNIEFSKKVSMSRLMLVVDVGFAPSINLQGTVITIVPKQFRPKTKKSAALATSVDASGTTVLDDGLDELNAMQTDTGELELTPPSTEEPSAVPVDTTPVDESLPYTSLDEDMSAYGPMVPDNSQLTFVGSLGVSGDSGILSCSMDGAVDLMGIILKDVGLMGQLDMFTLAPTGLGFRATMQITGGAKPKVIDFAAKMAVGATTTSYMWAGSYKGGLYFRDLVGMASKMMKRSPKATQKVKDEFFGALKKIPKIGIDELSMSIVPEPTDIAGKYYDQGASAAIKFALFGVRGEAAFQMNYAGMSGKGALTKIVLPKNSPLFILSSFDGTAGPSLNFNLGTSAAMTTLSNEFNVDGSMEIKPLAMKSAVKIMLSLAGGTFEVKNKPIFGLYQVDLTGSLSLSGVENTRIKAIFKQEALSKFSKQLHDASKTFIQESTKDIDKVRDDLRKSYDARIAAQRAIVKKEREKATGKLSSANQQAQTGINSEVDKARAQIANLEDKIKRAKRSCKRAKWYRKADKCAKTGVEIAGYEVALRAEQLYLEGLLKPGKTVVKGTIGVAKDTVNVTPVDADPRVASLIAAKETALKTLKVGSLSAESIGQVGKALATMGDQAINVKSVALEVALKDLVNGKLPKFSIEAIFFGQKVHLKNIQLDLKDPATAVAYLAEEVISKIKIK